MNWQHFRKRDAELEREFHSDLELEEEELRECGFSAEGAHYEALRAFGNPALLREQTRAVWSWNWFESLAQDLRSNGYVYVCAIANCLASGCSGLNM